MLGNFKSNLCRTHDPKNSVIEVRFYLEVNNNKKYHFFKKDSKDI